MRSSRSPGERRAWGPVVACGLAVLAPLMVGAVLQVAPLAQAVASPAPLFGRPVRPVPAGARQGPAKIANQVETSNWSGYVVARYETGRSYTSASGTWVVPAASQPVPGAAGYSASWVGIGGFCKNARCHAVDHTLIQLGTEQDVSASGMASYGAWYELLPNAPVGIPVAVSPGDTVVATLADGPNSPGPNSPGPNAPGPKAPGPNAPGPNAPGPNAPGPKAPGPNAPGRNAPGPNAPGPKAPGPKRATSWVLTFTDVTTGATWSTTLRYRSSLASAEWIEEAPASGGGILPLADYGAATFDPGSANGANPHLLPSEAVVMVDPQGQTSNPSAPDADTDGFATCWGSGVALTGCAAPAT